MSHEIIIIIKINNLVPMPMNSLINIRFKFKIPAVLLTLHRLMVNIYLGVLVFK